MRKCNARFIKKIGRFESDISLCRFKNYSLKQASGLIGGIRIPGPPWICHRNYMNLNWIYLVKDNLIFSNDLDVSKKKKQRAFVTTAAMAMRTSKNSCRAGSRTFLLFCERPEGSQAHPPVSRKKVDTLLHWDSSHSNHSIKRHKTVRS